MHSWVFRDLDDDTPMGKDRLDKFIADTGKLLELAVSAVRGDGPDHA